MDTFLRRTSENYCESGAEGATTYEIREDETGQWVSRSYRDGVFEGQTEEIGKGEMEDLFDVFHAGWRVYDDLRGVYYGTVGMELDYEDSL